MNVKDKLAIVVITICSTFIGAILIANVLIGAMK